MGFGQHPAGRIRHHEKSMGWSERGGGGKKCIGGQVSLLYWHQKMSEAKKTPNRKNTPHNFETHPTKTDTTHTSKHSGVALGVKREANNGTLPNRSLLPPLPTPPPPEAPSPGKAPQAAISSGMAARRVRKLFLTQFHFGEGTLASGDS